MSVIENRRSDEPLIFSAGTQVVVLREVLGQDRQTLHPRGAAGVVVKSPAEPEGLYRVRFPDGLEDVFARGDVMSQFKKMQADLRNQGQVKLKHAMHLIRLLMCGVSVLRNGFVPVRVGEHREGLLAIKRGELPWGELEAWRLRLHAEFDRALAETDLPERPDYEAANAFLVKARRLAAEGGCDGGGCIT